MEADAPKFVTITLSPLYASDLFTIIRDFVPDREANPTLKRLRVALRASGYASEEELFSAAGVEFHQRIADMKNNDEEI